MKKVNVRKYFRRSYFRRDGTKVKEANVNAYTRRINELNKKLELISKQSDIDIKKANALRAKYLAELEKARARSIYSKSKLDRVAALKALREKKQSTFLPNVVSLTGKYMDYKGKKAYEEAIKSQSKAREKEIGAMSNKYAEQLSKLNDKLMAQQVQLQAQAQHKNTKKVKTRGGWYKNV